MTSSTPVAASLDGTDDLWELAKARFLSDLDPTNRELFENATPQNIYSATSNINRDDAEHLRVRSIARRLGPLVSAIESYGKATDTFAQKTLAPLYLSPLWGSIRVVLVVARKYRILYERVVDTLERVGEILPSFLDYERICNQEKHQRLNQALSNAYLDIIVLCTQFRKIIGEPKRRGMFDIFLKSIILNRQCEEAIESFWRHRQIVEEEAKICHMTEAAEERDAESASGVQRNPPSHVQRRTNHVPRTLHPGPTPLPIPPCETLSNYDTIFGRPRACLLIILMFITFVLLSCFLGILFTIKRHWGYSMGDAFTLAGYVIAVGTLASTGVMAWHYPRCQCWAHAGIRESRIEIELPMPSQS